MHWDPCCACNSLDTSTDIVSQITHASAVPRHSGHIAFTARLACLLALHFISKNKDAAIVLVDGLLNALDHAPVWAADVFFRNDPQFPT